MSHAQLPIEALPAWCALNDVSFFDVRIAAIPGRGYGLVAERSLTTAEGATFDLPALLTVPGSLVLDSAAVQEYAKEDRNFKALLEAVNPQTTRGRALLFLLVQLVLAARAGGDDGDADRAGLSNPWTEYVRFLPAQVPVPTLWTEPERSLLRGTSLEAAVDAKLLALEREYDNLQEKSSDIPCWQATFWDSGAVTPDHWLLVDAWYRSRCLALSNSGEGMVPCIDMANHSATPNAYYEAIERDHRDEIALLLRPNCRVAESEEITIDYGCWGVSESDAGKSAAEMLFSYGFIDTSSHGGSILLPINPFPDDPLAKAKLHIFAPVTPTIRIRSDGDWLVWESAFAWLMCLNEEDGLEFRMEQDRDGEQRLRLFWEGEDKTDMARSLQAIVQSHPQGAVFALRVVTVVEEALQAQLARMQSAAAFESTLSQAAPDLVRDYCMEQARLLREIETRMLNETVEKLGEEKSQLLADEAVVAYLGSMEVAENDLVTEEASNEEDDFS